MSQLRVRQAHHDRGQRGKGKNISAVHTEKQECAGQGSPEAGSRPKPHPLATGFPGPDRDFQHGVSAEPDLAGRSRTSPPRSTPSQRASDRDVQKMWKKVRPGRSPRFAAPSTSPPGGIQPGPRTCRYGSPDFFRRFSTTSRQRAPRNPPDSRPQVRRPQTGPAAHTTGSLLPTRVFPPRQQDPPRTTFPGHTPATAAPETHPQLFYNSLTRIRATNFGQAGPTQEVKAGQAALTERARVIYWPFAANTTSRTLNRLRAQGIVR